MIQDSDIEVLDRVYYTPITPELVIREGFEREVQYPSKYPLIGELQFIHKELDIRLTQYDHHNIIVAKRGYPYAFVTKLPTPAIIHYNNSETGVSAQTNALNYSIYTYGQLLAIIEAKTKLNDLNKRIEVEVEDIVSTVYLANKYKISK